MHAYVSSNALIYGEWAFEDGTRLPMWWTFFSQGTPWEKIHAKKGKIDSEIVHIFTTRTDFELVCWMQNKKNGILSPHW